MSSENPNQFALTITFTDPDLTNEERDDELANLLEDLNANSAIESVARLRDPNPPDGNKSGGALLDLLKADATVPNALKVLKFLGDRLGNKPISLEAEVNGVKMKVSASSQEEIKFAINEINEFIEKHKA
ncbi:MAG: hypothetical protein ACK5YH_05925 [Pseudanabaena sp.]|jgi:hypothetical protein|uniref:hypothetical protein n=1 Tax=Pseudanabaena mucicola TaxID=71190 RepID=UPI002577F834|nr:hypothetical protein [Pseudanabaena mucicola]MCA6508421.1 hypothetical protein [Pseudanabaena sp. M109S1SP2A07QC]MCA6585264.1 hypothetical protein [Pseudanabaena sp. M051S1SP1A06QC]MCA6621459.1 hypothetical protein [Pseudanabaena sp. M165S2SP1A06QC]